MTSFKDYTAVTIPIVRPDMFGTGIGVEEKEKTQEERTYKVNVLSKTLAYTYSTGAILSSSLLIIAILFYILFIATLLYPIQLISTKLALFISLFSGAFAVEILIAKKLRR